jgi:23S rRNA (uracil1939-C5)-methyltransferase
MKLQIEKAVYGGSGLAHQTETEGAGRTVFVPFTLPGEVVEARPLKRQDSFEEASLIQVLTASKDRVQPVCAHFGQCGGCQYQHGSYSAQIQMKVAILRETFERAGLRTVPRIQVLTGEPWSYRNRTRLRIKELEGHLRVGYNPRNSNDFLSISECPILAPLLWKAAEGLLRVAAEDSTSARWLRNAVEVELFTSSDEKKLQISIFAKKELRGLPAFCEKLQKLIPELAGASTSLLASTGPRQTKATPPFEEWGAEGLVYCVAGEDYWVNRGGFFQINRFLVDELVKIVAGTRHGKTAWDLYAGVGLFSKALARTFQHVVAVEAAPSDLFTSFKGTTKRAIQATTLAFLRNAVIQRERPELIVVDPPRAGIGAEVCALLGKISAPEIVYVSCDPVTLARDLTSLTGTGYEIAELHMIDMFPQTFHLETVAVLRR